jgi:hypothetical protein
LSILNLFLNSRLQTFRNETRIGEAQWPVLPLSEYVAVAQGHRFQGTTAEPRAEGGITAWPSVFLGFTRSLRDVPQRDLCEHSSKSDLTRRLGRPDAYRCLSGCDFPYAVLLISRSPSLIHHLSLSHPTPPGSKPQWLAGLQNATPTNIGEDHESKGKGKGAKEAVRNKPS